MKNIGVSLKKKVRHHQEGTEHLFTISKCTVNLTIQLFVLDQMQVTLGIYLFAVMPITLSKSKTYGKNKG